MKPRGAQIKPFVAIKPIIKVTTPPTTATTLAIKPQVTQKPTVQAQGGGILRQFGGGKATIATPPAVTTPTVTIVEETGPNILTKLSNIWGGTPEQIQQLSTLKYINGNPIIDIKRRDIVMEIIGMLKSQSFNEVIDFLTDAPNPEYILWDQESMDEGKVKVLREIAIHQAEEVGVKGVGRCRYCPSTELVFAMKQMRAADEAMTVFVRCVQCNKQWRQ